MKEGLEEFLRRIEEKPTNETLIDRFVSLVLEEEILDRILYLKKLVGLLLNLNPYVALKIAALELQEARKERLTKEYEIGALKDVESCFLKLDKAENAQLVREEISKLMVENSRIQMRQSSDGEHRQSPESDAAAADRKAKLHFRLPQGGVDEPTALGEVPTAKMEVQAEKRPPVPPESQEGRKSALQISAIGVGPNLLESNSLDERQKLRNPASLFDRVSEFALPEEGEQDQPTSLLDSEGEPQRLSGHIIAESQQLHFPEQTQNLSMTNRYKTALAKPADLMRGQSPSPTGKPREERAFGNPYGEEDTGLRETRPLFPQQDQDPTEILQVPLPGAGVPPSVKGQSEKNGQASLPAETPPLPQPVDRPSVQRSPEGGLWDLFRERILISSGIQVDRKLATEYLQKHTGLEIHSEGFRRAMNLLAEAQDGPFSSYLQLRFSSWLFEEIDPKIMFQLWNGLRMEAEGPEILRMHLRLLLQQGDYRKAFHILRDLAVPGMGIEWAKVAFHYLPQIWQALHVKAWSWSEMEGVESFRDRLRRREENHASSALSSHRLGEKR
jgi:hypothetical protein